MSNIEETTNAEHQQEHPNTNLKIGMDAELYRAAVSGTFEKVRLTPTWVEQVTPAANSVLHVHLGRPSHQNSKDKTIKGMVNVQFIKKILESDVKLLWKANSKGDTPLHLAARFGHDFAVKELLAQAQEGARRLLRMINNKKDTALHDAARAGHFGVVEMLVKCDPLWQHEPNEEGETPLYLAAERGCTNSVLRLIETCNTNALNNTCKGPCGRTALHSAALWGEPEMVKRLLENDDKLIRVQDDEGQTPLHCATMEVDKSETLKVLLEYGNNSRIQAPAVYIQDKNGRTALHIAVLRCNWVAMNIIIASYPDCIETTDNNGQNVIHYIAKQACVSRIRNFLRLGHFDSLLNEKDVHGNTPLHIFATSILTDINPGHRSICLQWLSAFIKENPLMDNKAFNRNNLTFSDIIASHEQQLTFPLLSIMRKGVPRGRRIYKVNKDVNVEKAISDFDSLEEAKVDKLAKTGENQLVVAALIATVSFTSALTLPGGFNQNTGKDMGMAVLTSNGAFIAFLIFDILAFSCSAISILCYFLLANTYSAWLALQELRGGFFFTTVSLGAMGIALTTGVCAVVSHSPALVIVVLFIAAIFFICYIPIFLEVFRDALRWAFGCKLTYRSILPQSPQKSKCLTYRFIKWLGVDSSIN